MHTPYSDGFGSHQEIAQAALRAGLDVVIVTDHNVLVDGPEDYYQENDRRVLLLVGEEVHDQARDPQKIHLLIYGDNRELATFAHNPQVLLDAALKAGGISFIAHPVDPEAPAFGESDISWVDWNVQGYTGIELWNAMSEFKSLLKSRLHAIYYAFNPQRVAHGPFPEALRRWDELLSAGRKVVAIGGSDAHAFRAHLGPLRRILFPYEFHFHTVNTHLYIPRPLSGDMIEDRRLILETFARGRLFIGYDLPHSTRGFRFTAQGKDTSACMGDEISARNGLTFQIRLPLPAECHLIKDGKLIKTWKKRETCTHITAEPGIYRVEVYIPFKGKLRAWIISNPIYVTA